MTPRQVSKDQRRPKEGENRKRKNTKRSNINYKRKGK